MRVREHSVGLLALIALSACGSLSPSDNASSGDTKTTPASAAGSAGSLTGAQTAALAVAPQAKMARQSVDDTQDQSDLSESAATGTDDGGGSQSPQGSGKDGFDIDAKGHGGGAIQFSGRGANDDFQAAMTLDGSKGGRGKAYGSCNADVSHAGDGNVVAVLMTDMNRVLSNGDVLHIETDPNLVLTRSGSRDQGKVLRTIDGTTRRTLLSSVDANNNFDLIITHSGTTVVDSYASNRLTQRTLSGTISVHDVRTGLTGAVTFADLVRGKPGSCLCPTSGTVTVLSSGPSGSQTHTYTFSGTCGASTVVVDGAAAVATNVSTNSVLGAALKGGAKIHASADWQDCVPSS